MKNLWKCLPQRIIDRRRTMIQSYFAGSKEELEHRVEKSLEEQYKKVAIGIVVCVLCFIFFLINAWMESSQMVIERSNPDGEETAQTFQLKDGRKKTTYELWIPPKVWTKKERKKAFQDGFRLLERQMKGKNATINEVSTNLKLITKIPESPLHVAWDTSDTSVVSTEGTVYQKKVKQAVIVDVIATLTYQEEKQSKIFHVCVIPYENHPTKFSKAKEKIKEIEKNNRTKTSFKVPNKVLGVKVSFLNEKKHQLPMLCIFLVLIVSLLWYSEEEKQKKMVRESMRISLEEYPNMISRFVLLLGAGMTIPGVIESIAMEEKKSQKFVYQQLVQTNHQLKLGMNQTKALKEFSNQLSLSCYGKLTTMMIRSLTRGSKDLLQRLKEEESAVFLERKEIARRKGEEASTKLLLPMILMLLVILVLLMFPAFLSFST